MEPSQRIDEIVQKCFGWHPKTYAETSLEGLVYSAVSGYMEALEATGMYQGNGHHLAQRIAALVTMAMYPRGKVECHGPVCRIEIVKGQLRQGDED